MLDGIIPRQTPAVVASMFLRDNVLRGQFTCAPHSCLLPAVDVFARQTGAKVEIRSAPNFHDRYVFVDGVSCYQSGASFKDGAKSAPTMLTQITDAFAPVFKDYRLKPVDSYSD